MNFLGYDITEALSLEEQLEPWVDRKHETEGLIIYEGTEYGLPTVEALMQEWTDKIMESEEDWDLASEPDLSNFDDEWGEDANEQNDPIIKEHLAVRANKLQAKIKKFTELLQKNGLSVDGAEEMNPQRKNGILFQRIVWKISDGQTISGVFQVLGVDSGRRIPKDAEMVTFQWKVNSKDITRFLYPTTKKKLSANGLAKALGAYVQANTDSFAKKQARNQKLDKDLEDATTELDQLDTQIATEQGERDTMAQTVEELEASINSLNARIAELQKTLQDLKTNAKAKGDSSKASVDEGDDEEPVGDDRDRRYNEFMSIYNAGGSEARASMVILADALASGLTDTIGGDAPSAAEIKSWAGDKIRELFMGGYIVQSYSGKDVIREIWKMAMDKWDVEIEYERGASDEPDTYYYRAAPPASATASGASGADAVTPDEDEDEDIEAVGGDEADEDEDFEDTTEPPNVDEDEGGDLESRVAAIMAITDYSQFLEAMENLYDEFETEMEANPSLESQLSDQLEQLATKAAA